VFVVQDALRFEKMSSLAVKHSCDSAARSLKLVQISIDSLSADLKTLTDAGYYNIEPLHNRCCSASCFCSLVNYWLAMLQAISDPYCQTACLWLYPSVCLQHGLCRIDNVHTTLQSSQRREPRRLPACITLEPCLTKSRELFCMF